MRISIYSTCWNLERMGFDLMGALANWCMYADEIVIAVPEWDDESATAVKTSAYCAQREVTIVRTPFLLDGSDPLAYGKTENAALQACTGDLLIQQNLDERLRADPARLSELCNLLQARYDLAAFFCPVIDLYGSTDQYLSLGYKWRIHRPGFYRGPTIGTLKPDGRPDYNRTSTDELIDMFGKLAPTMNLLPNQTIESLRGYVAAGWPVAYHLGYLSLKDRLDRSVWWKHYWEQATGGDSNRHSSTIEELAARETKTHELPLWPTMTREDSL